MPTSKGGPAAHFLSSLHPLAVDLPRIRRSRVIRKQHSPALFARSAEDPARAEKDWDSCLFSGNQKNYRSPPSVGGTSPPPTSRGLRRVQGWQLLPGRAPSSRFLRILTPFLLPPSVVFSLSFSFFLVLPYRCSQFRLCILSRPIGVINPRGTRHYLLSKVAPCAQIS